MLCRDMKELRELVCQSRLEYHGSDCSDIDTDDFSDNRAWGDADLKTQPHRYTSDGPCLATTPDSGLASSRLQCSSTSDSDGTENVPARGHGALTSESKLLTKTFRFTTQDFAVIFNSIDHKLVARWLEDANAVIAQLSNWCHCDDNFVAFGHFWLSEFPAIERNSLIRMEHEIFVDRLATAFQATSDIRLCHITALSEAVLHEFPRRLLSVEGPRLVLHWLDVLTSPKRCEQFRKAFSSIHCSTTCHQHSEIVLSLRAFALVSVVSAFVNFYQKLIDNHIHQPSDESVQSSREEKGASLNQLSISEQRMHTSIRYIPVPY